MKSVTKSVVFCICIKTRNEGLLSLSQYFSTHLSPSSALIRDDEAMCECMYVKMMKNDCVDDQDDTAYSVFLLNINFWSAKIYLPSSSR